LLYAILGGDPDVAQCSLKPTPTGGLGDCAIALRVSPSPSPPRGNMPTLRNAQSGDADCEAMAIASGGECR
jgi:hypothetical protein